MTRSNTKYHKAGASEGKEFDYISLQDAVKVGEKKGESPSQLSPKIIKYPSSSINSVEQDLLTKNTQHFEFLIEYNEGQWSPLNPYGKKQYELTQLMKLRLSAGSSIQPRIKFEQIMLFPNFANCKNNKEQSKVDGFVDTKVSTNGFDNSQKKKRNPKAGRRNFNSCNINKNNVKPIIHLNLSLDEEVKLSETKNAWCPKILQNSIDVLADPEEKAKREKEELNRYVRGILNKLTPEKFEPLVGEIIKLKIDTMEKMEAILILVFEKAIDEPHFSVTYALLCQRLISEVKAAAFQRSLIDKTEQEFKRNVTNKNAKEEKLMPIREKIKNCSDVNECIELKALYDEEECKMRRRAGGTVRFMGELFKASVLTGKAVYNCVEALLKDPNDEDMLECLCKLVTTVGQKLEQTRLSESDQRKFSLEKIIQRMQSLATKNEKSKISSRIRFMLQDVIELCKKNWQCNRNEALKTMEQIEKEAAKEQLCVTYQPNGAVSNEFGNYQKKKRNSMSGRRNVISCSQNKNKAKPIVHLNLSLDKEVKLSETKNAWRPRILQNSTDVLADPEEKAKREKEELIRHVRGILNKLTPEKFEPLVEEIIKLKIDTMEKMEEIMILVFEKAVDEPHFSVTYALLCQRLISEIKALDEKVESGLKRNLAAFQRSLVHKSEQEFRQNVTNKNAKDEKLMPIREKIKNCSDVNECIELKALFDEEERKIRRRAGGTVRFIGELFKISILTGKIVYNCIEALLKDENNEDMLECMCKLVTTVGQKLEQTRISKSDQRKFCLEKIIQRMQSLATKNEKSKISSRTRFMLQDVIDLRKKDWQSNRNEAPKTMEQIKKQAAKEQSEGAVSNKRDYRDIRNADRNYGSSRNQKNNNDEIKQQKSRIGSSHSQSGSSTDEGEWQVQTRKRNKSAATKRFK